MLDIRDINGRIKEKPIPGSTIDYCTNFSNPHLGKPSYCQNTTVKLKYRWGTSSIKEVLFPNNINAQHKKSERVETIKEESYDRRSKRVVPKSMMYSKPSLDAKSNTGYLRPFARPVFKDYFDSSYKNQRYNCRCRVDCRIVSSGTKGIILVICLLIL
eukprot:TRINITY_DN11851_c0_g1_i4.p1 TRINITY_DN11851_c0_g1~~TRINITY_DN11851_c0_g1_i4.p1  ORF type:complete len:158 (+),score=15.66 TRINITY_DN11851_c0_g1_i4:108-581(+)